MVTVAWPSLDALIDPLVGQPFAEQDCLSFVAYLLKAGWGLDLMTESRHLTAQLMQVWFRTDPRPAWSLTQPWDCVLFSDNRFGAVDHVGMVVDHVQFVHVSRTAGVSRASLMRKYWQSRLVQIGRLRQLG